MTYDLFHLLMIGNDPDRETLESQGERMNIGAKVDISGMDDYKYVPLFFAVTDIIVTLSSSESFSLSAVEAIVTGLPVLSIDAPGTGDIIEDGITGLILPDVLAVFFANLVIQSMCYELRLRTEKQLLKASKKYDMQTTRNILLKPYQQLVDSARWGKKGAGYKESRFSDRFQ